MYTPQGYKNMIVCSSRYYFDLGPLLPLNKADLVTLIARYFYY